MHLLIDISAHGFGHLALVAPVINALHARWGQGFRLTVRSALPKDQIAQRIVVPFRYLPAATDFGFVMQDANTVDVAASAQVYREFHQTWEARVAAEIALFKARKVDAVLTCVSYLPLAAADRLGLRCAALCCLNWADLFAHFFQEELQPQSWATPIYHTMLTAYQAADLFLCPTPSMPMPQLGNVQEIGVIATLGQAVPRQELRQRLGLTTEDKLVLLGFGGIGLELQTSDWRQIEHTYYITPETWSINLPFAFNLAELGLSFTDALASVDAVVTKPGYGTFTEAACHGTPVVYVRRVDWPEQDDLIAWLHTHGRCVEIAGQELAVGNLAASLAQVWSLPAPPPPAAAGIAMAVDTLTYDWLD